ncbi:MAG: macro domain-containing protein [Methanobacteriota archaeon]
MRVDAIVNAANEALSGGGGVDGAIHRAAGPGLLAECRSLPELVPGVRCPTGEARITGAYGLAARHVIHTVGPVWTGGARGEDVLLASCYRSCLSLGKRHDVQTMAFPSIATGAYRFPVERAATIAVREVSGWCAGHDIPIEVTFVCFGDEARRAYEEALARHTGA